MRVLGLDAQHDKMELHQHIGYLPGNVRLYYTQGIQALADHSITGWYPVVLVSADLICGLAGLVIFNRRDLPTT